MQNDKNQPDESYDVDFLQRDWDGEGFDFSCVFVFERDQVTANRLIDFVRAAVRRFPLRKLGVLLSSSHEWTWIEAEDIDPSGDIIRTIFPQVPILIDLQLDDPENPELWFFFWLDGPDEFSFGAISEYYFSGSRREDRRRAENISGLAFLAYDQFGSAWTSFAEAESAREIVARNMSNNAPANVTSASDFDIVVKDILNKCDNLRQAEIESSGSGFIYSFEVGATVRVVAAAPDELRPGAIGTVGARGQILWLKKEGQNKKMVMSPRCRVEFADGSTAEIIEDYLEEVLPDRS